MKINPATLERTVPCSQEMVCRNLLEVKNPWPKVTRSFNARLIPTYLTELAKAGIFYESRII